MQVKYRARVINQSRPIVTRCLSSIPSLAVWPRPPSHYRSCRQNDIFQRSMNTYSPVDSHSSLELAQSQANVARDVYRFVANIPAADLDRALRATKIAAPSGELKLVLIACSELGLPLKGAALYVLTHLPDPAFFWNLYHSLAPSQYASKA